MVVAGRVVLVFIGAVLVALCVVGIGAASPTSRPYYTDELKVGNAIESDGVWWGGRNRAIDTASCLGLRRFGVRSNAYGLDKFHRFKCQADGADNHFYSV